MDDTRRLAEAPDDPGALAALWAGTLTVEFAEAVVLGKAALALKTAGVTGTGWLLPGRSGLSAAGGQPPNLTHLI